MGYGRIEKAIELLKWGGGAATEYTLDSPFLFELYQDVIKKKVKEDSRIREIEELRKSYLSDHTKLTLTDFGAGSFKRSATTKSISAISTTAVSSKRKCRLLFNLCQFFRPHRILELGTSLGISSLYMNAAVSNASITTIEGDQGIFQTFTNKMPEWAKNITALNGNFDEVIPSLEPSEKFDLVFIDGGHHSKILLPLINTLMGLTHAKTVFIIDDIYWSSDMSSSWLQLKEREEFNVAIDMWYFGILWEDGRLKEKLDVKLSPIKLWWKMGFFR